MPLLSLAAALPYSAWVLTAIMGYDDEFRGR